MKRIVIVLLVLTLSDGVSEAVVARGNTKITQRVAPTTQDLFAKPFSTSFIIPCCSKHAIHLYTLLERLEHQTKLPDEVVISLSEWKRVDRSCLRRLCNSWWRFPVRLILSQEKLSAGENRNRASDQARGEIFIYHDADDLPHPQRIEIIKRCFKQENLDHLLHCYDQPYSWQEIQFKRYSSHEIELVKPASFKDVEWSECVVHGVPALRRSVFEQIRWPTMFRGEDVLFNERVYGQFSRCGVARVPLFTYRVYLSAIRACCNEGASEKISAHERSFASHPTVLKKHKVHVMYH